jgi:hypothetical protein
MKKISILSLHLGHGGIEKAVTDLANNLCNKYEVKIVSVYKTFETLPFQVDSRVKIQYLMDGGIALKTDIYKKCIKQFKFIKLFSHLFKDYKFNIFKLINDVYLSIVIVINKRLYVKKYLKNSNDDVIISTLSNRLNNKNKEIILSETKEVTSWVFEIIKKVCS